MRARGVAAGAALLALLLAAPPLFAHGSECLFARVVPGAGGDITLELMADVAGNPLIPDPSEARGILAGALQVRIGDRRYRLEELGELTFEQRTRLGDDAPLPPGSIDGAHQLLTAVWHARLPGLSFTFVTPARTPHDVLLWDAAATRAPGAPRWMLLICGEESHAYVLPTAAATLPGWMGAMLLTAAFLVLGLLGWKLRSSTPHPSSAPAGEARSLS